VHGKYLHDLKHMYLVLKDWGTFAAGSTQPIECANYVARVTKHFRTFKGAQGKAANCSAKILEVLLRERIPKIRELLIQAEKSWKRTYNCTVCGNPAEGEEQGTLTARLRQGVKVWARTRAHVCTAA